MSAVESGFRQYIKNHTEKVPVRTGLQFHIGEHHTGRVWIPSDVNVPYVPPLATHAEMEILDHIDDENAPSSRILKIVHSLRFIREVDHVRTLDLTGFTLTEQGFTDPFFSLTSRDASMPLGANDGNYEAAIRATIESLQEAERANVVVFQPPNPA